LRFEVEPKLFSLLVFSLPCMMALIPLMIMVGRRREEKKFRLVLELGFVAAGRLLPFFACKTNFQLPPSRPQIWDPGKLRNIGSL
jgi:hypothetical protein